MYIREEILKRLLGIIAAGLVAGYGISELDTLSEKKLQEATKTAVETIIQRPESLFQKQEQKKTVILDSVFESHFKYEMPKELTKIEICNYYKDIHLLCKEGKDDEKTEI